MSRAPTSEEYSSLKQQYDQLLDKNQNDLIKIKQKERNLNVRLDRYLGAVVKNETGGRGEIKWTDCEDQIALRRVRKGKTGEEGR
jgi:hypothetical protein